MDKAITTILLTIAGVVSVMVIMNSIYPAISRSTSAVADAAGSAGDRIRTQLSIIHAAGELDNSGVWNDTNGDGDFDVFIWVKNVGDSRILAIEAVDIFFGVEGAFKRYPYVDDAGGSLPYWTFQIENDTDDMQAGLRTQLYALEKDLPPIDVMFLYRVIEVTGDIGDMAERIGRRLEVMIAH